MVLPLLGERAGARADVFPVTHHFLRFFSPFSRADGLVMDVSALRAKAA